MENQKTRGLFCFQNNLRISDHPLLHQALSECDSIAFVFCFDPQWLQPGRFQLKPLGSMRNKFLGESLVDLQKQLQNLGHELNIIGSSLRNLVPQLVNKVGFNRVYRCGCVNHNEASTWQHIESAVADQERQFNLGQRQTQFFEQLTHCLFYNEQLPFNLEDLPATFSQFKTRVIDLEVDSPLPVPSSWCAAEDLHQHLNFQVYNLDTVLNAESNTSNHEAIQGGSQAGIQHLEAYCAGQHPSHYKETRNELDGFRNSSHLSAWLAHGCLSPREIWHRIKTYEQSIERNDSTQWLCYELLWREYFQWYALKFGPKLFAFGGINDSKPCTTFMAQRFQAWCHGNTPFPLVNALMSQLNETGFMSNRGRQIAASCFVNELSLDWRYGAAYFEQQLIDYDIASNWGNWQYLAGVGADPRGLRHFNLDKQTAQYDPEGQFINKWRGSEGQIALDATDAADWPLPMDH